MTEAKAYLCIDATGAVAGGCIVVDQAKARHVIRTWLRSRSGCRVESIAIDEAYRLMQTSSQRRRTIKKDRAGATAHTAGHRLVQGRM